MLLNGLVKTRNEVKEYRFQDPSKEIEAANCKLKISDDIWGGTKKFLDTLLQDGKIEEYRISYYSKCDRSLKEYKNWMEGFFIEVKSKSGLFEQRLNDADLTIRKIKLRVNKFLKEVS